MEYKLNLPKDYVPEPLPGRDEWLTALRSGEYKQGPGALRKRDGIGGWEHCCLGVLCVLQKRSEVPSRDWADVTLFDGLSGSLQSSNPAYAALDSRGHLPCGVFVQRAGTEERLMSLASCNDEGLTFADIADIIEKVWKHEPKNW